MKKLLVVVDYQKDFVDGALGFEKAKALEEGIANRVIEAYNSGYEIIFTLDTHGDNYLNTQEGQLLPIEHCLMDTPGREIYGNVKKIYKDLADNSEDVFFEIPKYTFGSMQLGRGLETKKAWADVDEIEICGIVTNMCVISNAVICKAAKPETRIVINAGLCASFNDELHAQALNVMQSMQMDIINR